jgi:hypothetical protein
MTDDIEFLKAEMQRLDAKMTEIINFINEEAGRRADITKGIYERLGDMGELVWAMSEKVFPGYLADMARMREALGKSSSTRKKPSEE